jgi:hypothetical protein
MTTKTRKPAQSAAQRLLGTLRRRGLHLRAEDDHIMISPVGVLTPQDRDAIAACRQQLIALLRSESVRHDSESLQQLAQEIEQRSHLIATAAPAEAKRWFLDLHEAFRLACSVAEDLSYLEAHPNG